MTKALYRSVCERIRPYLEGPLNRALQYTEVGNEERRPRHCIRSMRVGATMVLVLMRMTSGLDYNYLAVFFSISPSTACYLLSSALMVFCLVFKDDIRWPEPEEKERSMHLAVERHGDEFRGKYAISSLSMKASFMA